MTSDFLIFSGAQERQGRGLLQEGERLPEQPSSAGQLAVRGRRGGRRRRHDGRPPRQPRLQQPRRQRAAESAQQHGPEAAHAGAQNTI